MTATLEKSLDRPGEAVDLDRLLEDGAGESVGRWNRQATLRIKPTRVIKTRLTLATRILRGVESVASALIAGVILAVALAFSALMILAVIVAMFGGLACYA